MAVSSKVGSRFIVGGPSYWSTDDASIAALTGGGFVASWIDGNAVHTQLFSGAGTKVGTPLVMSGGDTSVVSLENGGFGLAWLDGTAVRFQLFDAHGVASGPALVTDAGILGSHDHSINLTVLANGNLAVSWVNGAFVTKVFSPGGRELYSHETAPPWFADVSSKDDEFVKIWAEQPNGNTGEPPYYTLNCAVVGRGGVVTRETTIHLPNIISLGSYLSPSDGEVTMLETGDFVATWTMGGYMHGNVIQYQLFGRNGEPKGEIQTLARATDETSLGPPSITELPSGQFIIGWSVSGDTDSDVRGQLIDAAGRKMGAPFPIAGSETFEYEINLTTLADGKVVAIWEETGSTLYLKGQVLFGERSTVKGTALAERLSGTSFNDRMLGFDGDDTLVGSAGADRLEGGAGADLLIGGTGNDLYVLNDRADRISEAVEGGTDTVRATISFVLGANIENLTVSEDALANGTGNSLANTVTGNDATNRLLGEGGSDVLKGFSGNDVLFGGSGKDRLTGGEGADRFYFDTALIGLENVDIISDFSVEDDTIFLSRACFRGIEVDGRLSADAFHVGRAAADVADRIIYDQITGNIFYDRDGSGPAAHILFARVGSGLELTHLDFIAYTG